MLSFINIILVSMLMGIIDTKSPESIFCESGASNKSPVSCATQIWGQHASSSDECYMWFPGRQTNNEQNAKECAAMTFERGGLTTVQTDLGRLKLRTYFGEKNGYTLTAFNVSFTKIKWKHLKMRFQPNQNSNRFCREFTIQSPNETETEQAELFYDCIWANESIEHKAYNFEYQASDEKSTYLGRYLFNVPKSNNIKPSNKNLSQSELFAYIDVLHLPLLVLHVQTANERFDIGPENYAAFAHHNTTSGVVKTKLEQSTDEDGEISFVFNTNNDCGSFYFTVQIVHSNCSQEVCFITKTPTLIIPENLNKQIILIAIAGCGAIVLSLFFFVYFLWRRRNCAFAERPPTVLMIYAQTTKKHVAAVTELAKYLNDFCHVEVLIDELDIHKTTTKDPFTWCNNAINRSDFVMVLSSPFHNCRNYEGIYRNVDALGLKLLREKLSDRKSKQRFFSVVLPYCGVTDVPSEAKNLRRFVLMKDFSKLLAFLHTKSTSCYSQYWVQRIVYGLGSKTDIANDGQAMMNAMKMAGLELGKKKCDCEQSEDEAITQFDEFVTVNLKESCNDLPMSTQREKRKVTGDMYPGLIIDLNLSGSEGDNEEENHTKRIRNTKINSSAAIDINNLNLG